VLVTVMLMSKAPAAAEVPLSLLSPSHCTSVVLCAAGSLSDSSGQRPESMAAATRHLQQQQHIPTIRHPDRETPAKSPGGCSSAMTIINNQLPGPLKHRINPAIPADGTDRGTSQLLLEAPDGDGGFTAVTFEAVYVTLLQGWSSPAEAEMVVEQFRA